MVDDTLSGCENFELVGCLYGLRCFEVRLCVADVFEWLGFMDVGDVFVCIYFGGMRRWFDFGASLVGWLLVLIMDELSMGFDLCLWMELWGLIEEFVGDGTMLLLMM